MRPRGDAAVIAPGESYASVTAAVGEIAAGRQPRAWLFGFGLACALALVLLSAVTYLFAAGVGIWGVNVPVAWGFAIINLVWWIGIGHAGTLISAVLVLLRLEWRTSISRFAEAMTLFAVANAALFPVLHLGRPWLFYWVFPYPNTLGLLPQFRSPLIWDAFAIATYGTVSLLFWYVGLIPDLATLRDRASSRRRQIVYGLLAMGWRGSARHWSRYETAYLLLAALATPLVVSVHSIVSLDFAVSIIPGWHSTIFPPYFVAGAIFSGMAMVMTLALPLRRLYGLDRYITPHHLDRMAKVMLITGLVVAYAYAIEAFMAWYSGNLFEMATAVNRAVGRYAPAYWGAVACNVLAIQPLWFARVRASVPALLVISLLVNVGMWLERFFIVVTSLYRDFLPSAWHLYRPTLWDWATLAGTFGFFFVLFLLFLRYVPMMSMFEMRRLLHDREQAGEHAGAGS